MNEAYVQKALKTKKHRGLKNFLFVLLGMFLGIIMLLGGLLCVLKFVKIKDVTSLLGFNADEYVSSSVQDKSILDIALSGEELYIKDFPILEGLISDLAGGYVDLDSEKFNSYKLAEIGDAVADSFKGMKLVKLLRDNATGETVDKIVGILKDMTGKTDENTILVSDLEGKSMDTVKLCNILSIADNQDFYDIIVDGVNNNPEVTELKSSDSLTIGDFEYFSEENVKLVTILPVTADNENLYDFLRDATFDPITNEKPNSNNDITVGHLKSFDPHEIHLHWVLPYAGNEEIYNILVDGTGATSKENLKLNSLNYFNVDNVKISNILKNPDGTYKTGVEESNLLRILADKSNVTMGNIAQEVDNIAINDIWVQECFTTDSTQAVSGASKYVLNTDGSYQLDSTGTYYVSKNAKFWLFLYYTCDATDSTTGAGQKYVPKTVLYKDAKQEVDQATNDIENATIRQLVESGIFMGNYKTEIYSKTLAQVLASVTA